MGKTHYYDDREFNYEKYWKDRLYEDHSERKAINRFFSYISQQLSLEKTSLLDIGGGYGRLVGTYLPQVDQVVLLEPSKKLSRKAKKRYEKVANFEVIQQTIEKAKFVDKFEIILMVRVVHHLHLPQKVLIKVSQLLVPGGFLILEFANKINIKNFGSYLFQGKIGDYFSQERIDKRSRGNIKKETIPFFNYHPKTIETFLEKTGLTVLKKLSVSNFRSPLLKRAFPLPVLLGLETVFQPILAAVDFGPSMFLLARKDI